MAAPRIAVTGIGLVSAVGASAWSCAAAVRASIARFTTTADVMVEADPQGDDWQEAAIAASTLAEAELHGMARGARLLAPALRECVLQGRLRPAEVPSIRWFMDILVEQDEHDPKGDIFPWLAAEIEGLSRDLHNEPQARPGLSHCHFPAAVMHAAGELQRGQGDYAVVACADSLVEPQVLGRLGAAGMLKSARRPDGIVPGEAAGAVLLETEDHARARGAPVYALIAGGGSGMEPHPWVEGKPSRAEGLTAAHTEALAGLADAGHGIDLAVVDLTGERVRALEWALAEPRVLGGRPAGLTIWHPADCVGDCGGAMGAVQVVLAAVGLVKGYARSTCVLVSASDPDGARRALCLLPGNRADPRWVPGLVGT